MRAAGTVHTAFLIVVHAVTVTVPEEAHITARAGAEGEDTGRGQDGCSIEERQPPAIGSPHRGKPTALRCWWRSRTPGGMCAGRSLQQYSSADRSANAACQRKMGLDRERCYHSDILSIAPSLSPVVRTQAVDWMRPAALYLDAHPTSSSGLTRRGPRVFDFC